MRQPFRSIILFAAALLMAFAAFVNATISIPHLQEDMAEINVRPTLHRAISMGLHFGTFAMASFAFLILLAAINSSRGANLSRLPLGIIAVTYIVFGILAFFWGGSHHALGYALMGGLILTAVILKSGTP